MRRTRVSGVAAVVTSCCLGFVSLPAFAVFGDSAPNGDYCLEGDPAPASKWGTGTHKRNNPWSSARARADEILVAQGKVECGAGFEFLSCTLAGGYGNWCDYRVRVMVAGQNCSTQGQTLGIQVHKQAEACDVYVAPPPECEPLVHGGNKMASFGPAGTELPLAVCDTGSGFGSFCTFLQVPGTTTCGSTRCGALYAPIPETCTGGGDPPPESNDAEGDPLSVCQTLGQATYCYDASTASPDAQCGWLNGRPVCLGATPKAGCQELGGGALCDPAAATPPAPDNGTAGVVATADGQVQAESGAPGIVNNYNYYNSSTVTNSSVGAITGQPAQSGDYDGDGFTNPDQEAEFTGTYGQPTWGTDSFLTWGDGTGIWGSTSYGTPMSTKGGELKTFLANTFPFSLLTAGALTFGAGAAMPEITYTAVGHSASSSLAMWAPLFELFRASMAVVLLWGFWLVCLETVKGWSI